jgi:hypothetical protein
VSALNCRKYHAFFARMIEAGIAEGSLRPLDPDVETSGLE